MAKPTPCNEPDLISDVLDTIRQQVGIMPAPLARQVQREIRRLWGGETVYIARDQADLHAQRSARDTAIRNAYARGEHAELLARRHGLTPRRVNQIIATAQRRTEAGKSLL